MSSLYQPTVKRLKQRIYDPGDVLDIAKQSDPSLLGKSLLTYEQRLKILCWGTCYVYSYLQKKFHSYRLSEQKSVVLANKSDEAALKYELRGKKELQGQECSKAKNNALFSE
eukprot:2576419-Amphidinium_carterae.1